MKLLDPTETWFERVEKLEAEIERLRKIAVDRRLVADSLECELTAQDMEIERLRAERDDYKQCAETAQKFAEIKDTEIERLRAGATMMYQEGYDNAAAEAHFEIERLRAALQKIAEAEWGYGRQIARDALEQKP